MSEAKDAIDKLESGYSPGFNEPDFIGKLKKIAKKAIKQKTIEGYLSSLLIYHQIAEEMARVLVEYSDFVVDCSVYPASFSRKRKEDIQFGYLLNEVRNSMSFKERELFLNKCREFNIIRNKLVHELTKNTSLVDIKKQAEKLEKVYSDIEKHYLGSIEVFDKMLSKFVGEYLVDWDPKQFTDG